MSNADGVEQSAARWLSRLDRGPLSAAEHREFELWRAAAPAHAIAVARLEEVWKQADILDRRLVIHPRQRRFRQFAVPASIAASLLAVSAGGWWFMNHDAAIHSTRIGQHEEIRLADGSNVSLNTDTKLVAVVADGTREVWLDHGEAFFEIAHDRAHPFVVHAGGQIVTVLGTKFAIRQEGGRFRVSVLSGRVRLASLARSEDRPIILGAGEIATAKGADVLVSTEADHQQIDDLAWRRGTVIFDKVRLSQAIAELNRYSRRKLVLADPSLDDLEIGGRFSTNNVESFAQLLAESFNLRIDDDGGERIAIDRAGEAGA